MPTHRSRGGVCSSSATELYPSDLRCVVAVLVIEEGFRREDGGSERVEGKGGLGTGRTTGIGFVALHGTGGLEVGQGGVATGRRKRRRVEVHKEMMRKMGFSVTNWTTNPFRGGLRCHRGSGNREGGGAGAASEEGGREGGLC